MVDPTGISRPFFCLTFNKQTSIFDRNWLRFFNDSKSIPSFSSEQTDKMEKASFFTIYFSVA